MESGDINPCKKPDIDNTSTNGYPCRTKVDHAKLRKHSAPTYKGTGAEQYPYPNETVHTSPMQAKKKALQR